MAIIPTDYAQFVAQNFILSENGGSWYCSGFANQTCDEGSSWWSNNQTFVETYLEENESTAAYSMSMQASILVDTASFGGGNEISYSWSFLATGFSDHPSRDSLRLSSSVGDIEYWDTVPIQDLDNNQTWSNASYYLHTGTVVLEEQGPSRLLNLSLNLSLSPLSSEWVGIALRHIQLGLGPPVPTSSTSQSSAITSPTAIAIAPIQDPTVSATSGTPTSSIIPTGRSSPNQSTWIIPVSISCGLLAVIIFIFGAMLFWKRRQRHRRVSVSKVRNVKGASPLPGGAYSLDVIDIRKHESAIITPFYSSPTNRHVSWSGTTAPSLTPNLMHHPKRPPVAVLPLYTVHEALDQVNTIPIGLIRQKAYSNHRISLG